MAAIYCSHYCIRSGACGSTGHAVLLPQLGVAANGSGLRRCRRRADTATVRPLASVALREAEVPRVYRVMAAEDGRPRIGRHATTLGVRVTGDQPDIAADARGFVTPSTGGMSVAPSVSKLPSFRLPRRYSRHNRSASGKPDHFVWRHGEGPFALAPFAVGLQLRPDSPNPVTGDIAHGVIEPSKRMRLERYEQSLAATRDEWSIEEP